jgi:glycosyltransferase involved in cell wall biosynthesis
VSKTGVTVVATHVTPAKGYGGVAESVFNLCSAWARRHHAFRLCVSDGSMDGHITADAIGLPPSVRVDLYRAMLFKRWGFGPGAVFRLLRSCLASPVVYVCGIATWPTTLAAMICAILGRPFAVATRGGLMERLVALTRADKPLKWLFYRLLTFPTLRAAAFVHVTSELEGQGVRVWLPEARCLVVPNGLDLAAWPAAPATRQDRLTLCYVGRISREKGVNRFLRTWLANRQADERMIVVGDGQGDYAEQFRALVDQAGGAIEATGYVPREEIPAVLSRSAFLVLPSGIEDDDVRENFGNSVAESLATGRPVLVRRELAWDFVETEGLGLLFDQTDDSIAAAIANARATSAESYGRMCRAARAYAEGNFDITATADKLWSLVSALGAARQ